jgi:hypothetical protein
MKFEEKIKIALLIVIVGAVFTLFSMGLALAVSVWKAVLS